MKKMFVFCWFFFLVLIGQLWDVSPSNAGMLETLKNLHRQGFDGSDQVVAVVGPAFFSGKGKFPKNIVYYDGTELRGEITTVAVERSSKHAVEALVQLLPKVRVLYFATPKKPTSAAVYFAAVEKLKRLQTWNVLAKKAKTVLFVGNKLKRLSSKQWSELHQKAARYGFVGLSPRSRELPPFLLAPAATNRSGKVSGQVGFVNKFGSVSRGKRNHHRKYVPSYVFLAATLLFGLKANPAFEPVGFLSKLRKARKGIKTHVSLLDFIRQEQKKKNRVCEKMLRPGTLSHQVYLFRGKKRYYSIHVPKNLFKGTRFVPVLFDLHGLFSVSRHRKLATLPSSKISSEMIAFSEKVSFLFVRPLSSYRTFGTFRSYRWKAPRRGEKTEDVGFLLSLFEHLQHCFRVDAKRVFISGFSNGSNMAFRMLGRKHSPFQGAGIFAGGLWGPETKMNFGLRKPRIYISTGAKDYMSLSALALKRVLKKSGFPEAALFEKKSMRAHTRSLQSMKEMWLWLDKQKKSTSTKAKLSQGWKQVFQDPGAAFFTKVVVDAKKNILVAGEKGQIWRRSQVTKEWKKVAIISGKLRGRRMERPTWTGLCSHPDGTGIVVGGGFVAKTSNDGKSWQLEVPAPSFLRSGFRHYSYLTDVVCGRNRGCWSVGYWSGLLKRKNTSSLWALVGSKQKHPLRRQVLAVAENKQGTMIAAGRYFLARGKKEQWKLQHSVKGVFHDIVSSGKDKWWLVGEDGRLLSSKDDGKTWVAASGKFEQTDLYGVDFFREKLGVVVGEQGKVFVTKDGGKTWKDISPGINVAFSDVKFLDSQHFLVVGGLGKVLQYSF